MSTLRQLSALPVHPRPDLDLEGYRLRVDGLVAAPMELTVDDLLALPQHGLHDDFSCLDGWVVPDLDWRGPRLGDVIEMARPASRVGWVQASFRDFSLPLPLEKAPEMILALTLNGAPLALDHGAPVRLMVPDGECFTSVKWLAHLELREQPDENTARGIALARLGL
jgi:DMSO/TMAO reductase YedYZ molybdopterin-dependent catalytic subunit